MNADAQLADARNARAILIECFIVAAIVFAAYAASHPDAVATLGRLYDDVVYLSVGKSIADGHGYRSAQLVGTPVHVKFPPLLPAIYAIGWAATGSLGSVARLALWLNIAVTAIAMGTLWWLARRELRVGPALAALFVGVPIIADRTMFYFSGAASEPWMLLGWAAALVLVRRLTRSSAAGEPVAGTALTLGLTLAATVLARTQGVAIAAAVLAGLTISRVGWRGLAIAAATTAAPIVVWTAWHAAMMARGPLSPLPDQQGYVAWIPTTGAGSFLRFAATMVRTSVPLYWASTGDILVGWTSTRTLVLAAALLIAGGIGTLMLVRTFPAMAASVLATLGVLAIWPYVQDRFLTPVLPMLGVAGAFAVQRALLHTPVTVRRGVIVGTMLLTAALFAENSRTRIESARGSRQSPYAHAIDDIVAWVDRNTAPGDRIMASWGGAIYLRTGRRTSIANPEEPALGKSVLDSPYEFYATRLRVDSVDDAIIWDRAPGRAAAWLRALGARCPGLLTEAEGAGADSSRNGLHYYRVRRDLPCLVQVGRADSSRARVNKNAP